MKKLLYILVLVLLILSNYKILNAAPFDTGMITLKQPNDVTFTGRIWGDEFIYWMETENGYRFVETFEGWYYYAALDQNGEYTPTNYKVGIDSPPSSAYQLERSQARLNEINEQIEQFNEQIEINRQWFVQKQEEAQGQPVTLKVGIILIGFTDTLHYQGGNRPNGYLTTDFDSMMFSYNYWTGVQGNQKHPEEEAIFGSFRDYWHQISIGKLRIEGRVANNTDQNGVPVWLEADYNKQHYYESSNWQELSNEAIAKALADSLIDTTNTNSQNYFDKLVIVYAGVVRQHGALLVNGHRLGGKYILVAERSSKKLIEGAEWSFTHIGVYAHEFGHNLGFNDEYALINPEYTDILNYCLMSWGIYNGPLEKGECPSMLSPYHRLDKNWVSSITIPNDTSDFIVEYDYDNPKLYRIDPIYAIEGEHYIMESRNREGFDLYTPSEPADTIYQPGRLLVWHHDIDPYPFNEDKDRIMVKPADNGFDDDTKLTDFFPKQIIPNSQDLTDITLPASTLGRIGKNFSNERPAHFSLNGIEKLSNGNTYIEEIKLDDNLSSDTATVVRNYQSGWRTASVPVVLSDFSVQSVFPTANSVYKYLGGYISVSNLENGHGYWVNFQSNTQKTFVGWPLNYLDIMVLPGWNITGTLSSDFQISNICTEPENIIDYIYGYENGYVLITKDSSLIPGKGYWVKTKNLTGVGHLILNKYGDPCWMPKITTSFDLDLSKMDKFIVTDSAGNSQTLYVSNTDIDTIMVNLKLDLPPIFAELDFDSRFAYNDFIKKVSVDSGIIDLNILVHTNAYPVGLTWELNPENGLNYSFINDSGTGKVSASLNELNQLTFYKLNDNMIRLSVMANERDGLSNIPLEYALHQNYPNPFNPYTTIKYDIIKMQDVKFTIYDILGREIKTLVNEQQQPGIYVIRWDASDVSSGVYFYQLKTKDYINTKKMILLK
ncbi:MAG: T9SS type A sorting domain-containing protein [Ignavibacteriaceae bacterium]|nr:T9SS type A sorting domain-containing protein [Ignavibacteriaceae bacterium]